MLFVVVYYIIVLERMVLPIDGLAWNKAISRPQVSYAEAVLLFFRMVLTNHIAKTVHCCSEANNSYEKLSCHWHFSLKRFPTGEHLPTVRLIWSDCFCFRWCNLFLEVTSYVEYDLAYAGSSRGKYNL